MTHFSRRVRAARRGFTLIELLTVIAIIAILTGMLFPIFATVGEQMRQGSCMSNMHGIVQGLQMYKDDWKVYPEALYGIQYVDNSGAPLTPFEPRLYPAYVKSNRTFWCPNSQIKLSDNAGTVIPIDMMTGLPAEWRGINYAVRDFSQYDAQQIPNPGTPPRNEVRYRLKRTPLPGGLSDDQRQLFYRNPPESTVVTWCTNHARINPEGIPRSDADALVVFLSGNVKKIRATRLMDWSGTTQPFPWQVSPNSK